MPAFGDADLTRRSVASILKNTHNDFTLIVVNNGMKETDSVMEEFLPNDKIKYIVSETNEGCGGGRNLGMKELDDDFEYLIIVDSDIYAPKNWDKRLVEFMRAHPGIGLAGPSTNYAGSPQLIKDCPEMNTDEEVEAYAAQLEEKGKSMRSKYSICPQQWPVIGFCQIIKREVFEKVGFFDETFKFYGCEDNDYCWRIQKEGYELAYIHNIFVYHRGHGGYNLLNGEETEFWGKNKDYFIEKHGWI